MTSTLRVTLGRELMICNMPFLSEIFYKTVFYPALSISRNKWHGIEGYLSMQRYEKFKNVHNICFNKANQIELEK